MSSARSMRCSRCGADFNVVHLSEEVQCSHCGTRQALAADIARELSSYVDEYAARVGAANEALRRVDAWDQWVKSIPAPGRQYPVAFGLFFGLPVLTIAGAALLSALSDLDALHDPRLSLAIMGSVVVAMVAYFAWSASHATSKPKRELAAGTVDVACPNCGAPNVLAAGADSAGCRYCSAVLMPSATAVVRALDAGMVAQRKVALESVRAERLASVHIQSFDASNAVPYFVTVPFLLMLGVGSFSFSYEVWTGQTPYHPALLGMWCAFLAVAGGFAAFLSWKRRRRQEWIAALEHLARQFGGSMLTRPSDQVAWLNAFWATEYAQAWTYFGGQRFGSVALNTGGYSALVDTNPDVPGGRHPYVARVNIALAGYLPIEKHGLLTMEEEPKAIVDALRASGFLLHFSTTGILAEADAKTLKLLKRRPDALHALAPVISQLTTLAQSLGIQPVGQL